LKLKIVYSSAKGTSVKIVFCLFFVCACLLQNLTIRYYEMSRVCWQNTLLTSVKNDYKYDNQYLWYHPMIVSKPIAWERESAINYGE